MKRKNNKNIEELKTQIKTTIVISKILCPTTTENHYNEEELNKDGWGVLSPDKVCMIIGKNNISKKILNNFVYKDDNKNTRLPELYYDIGQEDVGNFISSKYSVDYLLSILKIFNTYDSNPKVSMKEDYPLTLEDDYFKIILAPRVE